MDETFDACTPSGLFLRSLCMFSLTAHCKVSVSMKDSACSWVMPPGWRAALQMGLCTLQCLNWQSWEQYLVIWHSHTCTDARRPSVIVLSECKLSLIPANTPRWSSRLVTHDCSGCHSYAPLSFHTKSLYRAKRLIQARCRNLRYATHLRFLLAVTRLGIPGLSAVRALVGRAGLIYAARHDVHQRLSNDIQVAHMVWPG